MLEQSEQALETKTKDIEEKTRGFEEEKLSLAETLAAKETSQASLQDRIAMLTSSLNEARAMAAENMAQS